MSEIIDLNLVQKKISNQQFAEALSDLEARELRDPENTEPAALEALYMKAVCQRYLSRYKDALASLDTLKSLSPNHGRAYQEEGHVYRGLKNWSAARLAYQRACQFNPALLASYRGQIDASLQIGEGGSSQQIGAHLERLQQLPKPLLAVTDLMSEGKLLKAEEICREFLKRVPSSVEGMRLLASIGSRLGVLDDADFLLASAIKFAPDNIQLRIDYIQILRKRQQFLPALEQAKTLLSSAPENPQFQSIYAVESMQTGDFDIALEYFEKVLKQLPGDPVTLTSRGHALKTNGSFQQAVASYQEAINSQSQYGEAYYALANLKTYRFTEIEIEQMLVQDKNPDLLHQDRIFICFALGKAYEDQADYKQSFSYYERGNQLKLAQSRYKRAQMTDELSAQIDVCTESLFKRHRLSGCLAADPIFVVGLPRSGSTLLEQILSSHSQVDGTMELPNIMSLSHKLRRGGTLDGVSKYPEVLSKMDPDQLRSFGESYISDTLIHRDGAPFFIDKMPNNFRHIGLIKLILPNAKIIDARRHPLACCFSAYKQLFAEGQEFTYGLEEVGNYYRDYVQLMAHWDKVLPGFVLRVQHEEVVADLEHQVARLLDFCGLPFEESCLRFFETKRKIRTPSSEQVRQPIYNDALEQWRNFEEYLQPLKQALGSEIMMPELTAANK